MRMTIGERIRKARKFAGMTQEELADRIGVARISVTRWEKGYRNINLNQIKKIAEAIDVPFETLMLDDERSNTMDESKTINFGSGPVGFSQEIDEERLKAMLDEINKETKEAGLPWWAGMFNPKIVEATHSGISKCNCGEDVRVYVAPHEEKQICDMEHQRERIKKADEQVIEAIGKANTALEKLEQCLVENDLRCDEVVELSQNITAVCDTIAKLRSSMNINAPFYGFAV